MIIKLNTGCDELKTATASETSNLNTQPLPRLAYTMRETADILGVSYITVYRLLKRGKLRASDALRAKVISVVEINRFLNDTTQGALR